MSKKILSVLLAVIMVLSVAVTMVFASDITYKQGDIIEFGSYPQSQVTDESLINELNNLELEWKSINQYVDWEQIAEVYKYADVEYNNEKYRIVCSVESNETSWYVYEPIEWVVIDPETGYVLCNVALDAKSFQLEESKHYADADWETSDIRRWLNDDFYQDAFSADQTKSIITTNTDMSIYNDEGEITGYNTVSDNIVLFSLEDALNEQYGYVQLNGNREFNSHYYVVTGELGRYSTDYAYNLGAKGFEELENADWAEEYKGCKWVCRKNTESAYRPTIVHPKSPAAYFVENGEPFYYGYYDEETGNHVYAYGDASGYICLIDPYDLAFSVEIYGICPAMHINLETFDKEQIPGDLEETPTVPEEDTTVPEEDTTVPEEDTTIPEEDTTVPEEDTTVPEEDTTAPEEDTTVPEEDTTAPEEDTTVPDEPITDGPATDGPENVLTPNPDSNIAITDTVVTLSPEMSVENVIKSVSNEKVVVLSTDGTELTADALVGTGNKIQVFDNDGNVLSEYEVMVKSDVDGNGKITPADARLALRASANIDKIEGVFEAAANYDDTDAVSTADARMILRKAAGLE